VAQLDRLIACGNACTYDHCHTSRDHSLQAAQMEE
jgi:hypothetical protein